MNKSFFFIAILFALFISGFDATAQETTNDEVSITSLIEKKREYNKYNFTGYRIQIYNGVEKNARSYKFSFNKDYPGVYSKLSFEYPEWKVQVGYYYTRLQADRALNKIREKFSGAIIIRK